MTLLRATWRSAHINTSTQVTADSRESSVALFSQLLLEVHSMIFQPLDCDESVSNADEKNRNHPMNHISEPEINIVRVPDFSPGVTFDPWHLKWLEQPLTRTRGQLSRTALSLRVICQQCVGCRSYNRGLTLHYNVIKLILSLSLCKRKKISPHSRYFILGSHRPHTHWALCAEMYFVKGCPSGFLSFTYVEKPFLQILVSDSSTQCFTAEVKNLPTGD